MEFEKQMSPYPIFSLQEIRKAFLDFSYRQLERWEKKRYVMKIRRQYYMLTKQDRERNFLWFTSNKIYAPSYISLETALKFYGFIPEEIFQITSISTKKTVEFKTAIGNFKYHKIKPQLFFGYHLMDFRNKNILIADPEKAILDYLYFHPNIKTENDIHEIRINSQEFHEQIDRVKFMKYLEGFGSKTLNRRAKIFLKYMEND